MRAIAVLLFAALPACGDAGEADLPGPTVSPQPITYSDIEANELYGAGCAYASGTSMAPIVIASATEAVMKLDGQIHRFRADIESEGAASPANSRYLAPDRVLHLAREGEGSRAGEEAMNFDATVRLVDGAGAVLYETSGTAQCAS